ncbi:hypothetical protein PpBr36_03128 [Pyricularia pennisetigena]|uniref:hypothetical protein n=1 Tax=Pyricularia pennisetigena TaxID=1578925 RepID=UPI00115227DF|nr:hypothetical protein PpBr36_03128 [Pyricularia pennisetigena]TLS30575.1 hypothetical protein PpBr36_03128 [Pyricularia pennisetigena]
MTETPSSNGGAETPKTYTAFFYGNVTHGIFISRETEASTLTLRRIHADNKTQMASEVFFTVCFRMADPPQALKSEYTFRPAILHGYCRRRVKNADYPGIVPDAEHTVRGTYVTGLTEANLVKLDFFEGSEYDRLPVKVKLLEKVGVDKGEGNVEGAEVETNTYVFRDKALLEDKEWDFDHFRNERMKHWTREDYCFSSGEPADALGKLELHDQPWRLQRDVAGCWGRQQLLSNCKEASLGNRETMPLTLMTS